MSGGANAPPPCLHSSKYVLNLHIRIACCYRRNNSPFGISEQSMPNNAIADSALIDADKSAYACHVAIYADVHIADRANALSALGAGINVTIPATIDAAAPDDTPEPPSDSA